MIVADYIAQLQINHCELDSWLKFLSSMIVHLEQLNPSRKKVKAALAQIEVQELERMYAEAVDDN